MSYYDLVFLEWIHFMQPQKFGLLKREDRKRFSNKIIITSVEVRAIFGQSRC